MAVNKVELANRALVLLGEEPIQSFQDENVQAQTASVLYDQCLLTLLSEYPWRFATKIVTLAQLTGDSVAQEWKNRHALPSDYLTLQEIEQTLDFQLFEGLEVHSNHTTLTLVYTYRPLEHWFPGYFQKYLVTQLAADMAYPITEDDRKAEYFQTLADVVGRKSRHIDSKSSPRSGVVDDGGVVSRRFS